MSARILIVDDDKAYARALTRSLERAGHDVTSCETAQQARDLLDTVEPDVVILDYQLPDADGLALLDELRPRRPGAVFLINTAYPDLDLAVTAIRKGAHDYVAKDGALRETLIRVDRAVTTAHLRSAQHGSGSVQGAIEDGMIGESPKMVELRARLERLKVSDDTTVMIVGETGTGKGVLSRLIHKQSVRAYEPFVAVDCTTIPMNLMESELFGHERGAFTGAERTKTGKVEVAGQGTLFLDEIGELDLNLQKKLLRLLEEKEFTRVGGEKARTLNARVVAATNRNLDLEIAQGNFRQDLRFRLEVFTLEVPPLRERGDDIQLLAKHFADERARAMSRNLVFEYDDRVLEAMSQYPFPGNVREMRNLVEQAALLARDNRLTLEEFPVLSRFLRGWEAPGNAIQTIHPPLPPSSSLPPPTVGDPGQSGSWRVPDGSNGLGGTYPPGGPPVSNHPYPRQSPPPPPPQPPRHDEDEDPQSLDDIRRRHEADEKASILWALKQTGGNVSRAARLLSISRHQLIRRIRKYELDRRRTDDDDRA